MHGIKVLLKVLKDIEKNFKAGDTVIEIGSTRDIGSTYYIGELCTKHNLVLYTIDPNPKACEDARKVLDQFNNPNLNVVNAKGEDFLRTYDGSNICLSYLDGFDIVTDHPHLQSTIDAYAKDGIDLLKDGNRISAEVHLDATESIFKNSSEVSYYCFDDTWKEKGTWMGKGATAIPFLLSHGGKLITKESKPFWKKRPYNHGVVIEVEK